MMEWDNKYRVGISVIDEEHKEFIEIINKAVFATEHIDNIEKTKKIIGKMLEYSGKHFTTEEIYMRKFKFLGYEWHRAAHLEFADKAIMSYNKLVTGDYQIANALLEYLKRWFIDHIEDTDKKFVNCFKENGLK